MNESLGASVRASVGEGVRVGVWEASKRRRRGHVRAI